MLGAMASMTVATMIIVAILAFLARTRPFIKLVTLMWGVVVLVGIASSVGVL